jgi:hypothetical protein
LPTQYRRRGLICYVGGVGGATVEHPLAFARVSVQFALAAAVIAGLVLSACGRAGAPELPPGPAIQAVPTASSGPLPAPIAAAPEVPAAAGGPGAAAAAAQNVAAKTGFDAEGNPAAPPGQKKPFLLDPLLQ